MNVREHFRGIKDDGRKEERIDSVKRGSQKGIGARNR